MKPTISVIIPCKDGAEFIPHLFKDLSAPALAGKIDEIVFVDDCSDDGSKKVADLLATKLFNGINYISCRTDEFRGCGGARNEGVSLATSDYIFFCDVDDRLHNCAIENIRKAIEENDNPDCVILSFTREQGGQSYPTILNSKVLQNYAFAPVAPWAKCFKRELFVPFIEKVICEDTPWWFLQADRFEKIAYVEEPIVRYNRNNKSAITQTVEWCATHPFTLETLAYENILIANGLRDNWVGDFLRNVATMYDIRNKLKKPEVKLAWSIRFKQEVANLMTGRYVH